MALPPPGLQRLQRPHAPGSSFSTPPRPVRAAAYERAIATGAQVVIGPLVREDITAVVNARMGALPVPTLALNSSATPDVGPPPAFLLQFALDPAQEARAVARRIAADGLVRGVALFPDSTWGQRVREAFTSELAAAGGVTLMAAEYYGLGANDYSGTIARGSRTFRRRGRAQQGSSQNPCRPATRRPNVPPVHSLRSSRPHRRQPGPSSRSCDSR